VPSIEIATSGTPAAAQVNVTSVHDILFDLPILTCLILGGESEPQLSK